MSQCGGELRDATSTWAARGALTDSAGRAAVAGAWLGLGARDVRAGLGAGHRARHPLSADPMGGL